MRAKGEKTKFVKGEQPEEEDDTDKKINKGRENGLNNRQPRESLTFLAGCGRKKLKSKKEALFWGSVKEGRGREKRERKSKKRRGSIKNNRHLQT